VTGGGVKIVSRVYYKGAGGGGGLITDEVFSLPAGVLGLIKMENHDGASLFFISGVKGFTPTRPCTDKPRLAKRDAPGGHKAT
jgi:hypothetical protein